MATAATKPGPAAAKDEPAAAYYAARHIDNAPTMFLAISTIDPSPWNPRKSFDQAALEELAASLKKHGLLQPLVVRPVDGGRFQIVAGERRWRAAQLAGMDSVWGRIVELDDRAALEVAIIENLHRADLDPIEQAQGYRALAEHAGMTQTAIAAAVKVTQPTIAKALGLLKLPEDVQELIRTGSLTASHGEVLLKFAPFPAVVSGVATRVVHGQITTKQLADRPLVDTWQLSRDGLIRRIVDGGFDTTVCDACPFGARYGKDKWESYCLKPEHFDELAIAAKREQQRETNRLVQAAKRDGKEVLKLAGMAYGSYEQLRRERPAGCTDACPCCAQALDHGNLLVPICTQPERYRKLVNAAQRAERTARKDAQQGRRDALAAQLAGLDEPTTLALAVIAAKILHGSHTLSEIRPIAATWAPGLDLADLHSLEWSNRMGLLEALAQIPVMEQIRLLVAVLVEADIRTAAEMEMHQPALADWYLQRDSGQPVLSAADLEATALAAEPEDDPDPPPIEIGGTLVSMHDGERAPAPDEVRFEFDWPPAKFSGLLTDYYCGEKIAEQGYKLPRVKAYLQQTPIGMLLLCVVAGIGDREIEAWELVEEAEWGDRPKHELWHDERLIEGHIRGRGDHTGSVVLWRGKRYVAARKVIVARGDTDPLAAKG